MKKAEIELHCTELVTPILDELHFELVDVEYVREVGEYYLRVYIDKEGGINIDDCVTVSRALEAKLDEADKLEDAYILEVSSPGLTRPLKKEKDFARSMGKDVEIHTYRSINRCKDFCGVLKVYDANTVTIETDGEEMVFEKSDIALIRQAIDF